MSPELGGGFDLPCGHHRSLSTMEAENSQLHTELQKLQVASDSN